MELYLYSDCYYALGICVALLAQPYITRIGRVPPLKGVFIVADLSHLHHFVFQLNGYRRKRLLSG